MKTSQLLFFIAGLGGLASAAQAVRNPQPPPSGIVVHLFGPGSITSNIMPSVLPTTPAPSAAPTGEAGATGPAKPASSPAYVEPTMGQVLHQMFVVGNPDQLPGQALSTGRATERP